MTQNYVTPCKLLITKNVLILGVKLGRITSTVTLTQPAPLSPTLLVRNAICGSSNGSITTVITGGTPAYTYSWSNGGSSITSSIIDSLTNLTAGTYSVTIIDANGCTATKTAIIGNVSSAIINVIPPQQTISQGGSIAITVMGGVTYTWLPAAGLSCTNCANPTAIPLITTTYTVTATDANGCTVTAMMTVTVKKACEDESDVYVAIMSFLRIMMVRTMSFTLKETVLQTYTGRFTIVGATCCLKLLINHMVGRGQEKVIRWNRELMFTI